MMFYCFCEYINYLIGNLLCEVKLSNEILFFSRIRIIIIQGYLRKVVTNLRRAVMLAAFDELK